jgi:hypothetical protein
LETCCGYEYDHTQNLMRLEKKKKKKIIFFFFISRTSTLSFPWLFTDHQKCTGQPPRLYPPFPPLPFSFPLPPLARGRRKKKKKKKEGKEDKGLLYQGISPFSSQPDSRAYQPMLLKRKENPSRNSCWRRQVRLRHR